MSSLTTLLQSLGNHGAMANARLSLQAREREDWIVEALARRLDPVVEPVAVPAARAARQPVRAA